MPEGWHVRARLIRLAPQEAIYLRRSVCGEHLGMALSCHRPRSGAVISSLRLVLLNRASAASAQVGAVERNSRADNWGETLTQKHCCEIDEKLRVKKKFKRRLR